MRFEVVTELPFSSPLQGIFAPPKSQNALTMGCFAAKNHSKMGQKSVFPEIVVVYLECANK